MDRACNLPHFEYPHGWSWVEKNLSAIGTHCMDEIGKFNFHDSVSWWVDDLAEIRVFL